MQHCRIYIFKRRCIWVTIFYLNQAMGGGYHASTHIHRFWTMAFGMPLGAYECETAAGFDLKKIIHCCGEH